MSFINKIFSIKDKKTDLSSFAQSPLLLMEAKAHPFDDWKDPEVDVPEELRQMFNLYSWLYQLYMFYMLTSESFGNDLAVRVVELQDKAEKDILGTTMFNIYENINNIHAAVLHLLKNPFIENIDGEKSEMPLEYGLAKKFLFSGDFSPIKYKEEDIELADVSILGLCLFHCKQPAIVHFEKLISNTNLKENA